MQTLRSLHVNQVIHTRLKVKSFSYYKILELLDILQKKYVKIILYIKQILYPKSRKIEMQYIY